MKKLLRAFQFFAVLVAVTFILACHAGHRLTRANVNEVTEGMSKKQVESILGPPTAIDTTNLILLKKTTYTYKQSNDVVTVVFQDDKVQSKESTLSQ
jgi:hypothetical protein